MRNADPKNPNGHGVRFVEWLVVAVAAVVVLWGTPPRPYGELAVSRLATIYSLTHYGSFYLDAPEGAPPNPFADTIDQVMVKGRRVGAGVADGRMVSSKPPVLPLIMTAEYLVLNKVAGWDLDNEADVPRIVRFMTLTLVGAAYVVALVFFVRLLRLMKIPPAGRIVMLAALAFGTQLWGFGAVLNNHVPAAAMLLVALYSAAGLGTGALAPTGWRFFVFGLASGLVAVLDVPSGIFGFFAAVYLVAKCPGKTLTWALAGAAIPVGIHIAVMIPVTGSPLPVQAHKETYLYETSYWRHPMGVDGLSEPKGTYLFHMTFGRRGLFSLYPILLAGLTGAVRALTPRTTPHRWAILAGAAAFAILTAYYAVRTNNYGGECYGFRWYIVSMPVLLLMGAPVFATARRWWHWAFIALMLAMSCYSAWECSTTGWESGQEWTRRFLGASF